MTLIAGTRAFGASLVAADRRLTVGGGGPSALDMQQKLHHLPGSWAAVCTVRESAFGPTMRQLSRLAESDGPHQFQGVLADSYDGSADDPGHGTILVSTVGSEGPELRTYRLDGEYLEPAYGQFAYYAPADNDVEDFAGRAVQAAFGEKTVEGAADVVRAVGGFFARVAEQSDHVSSEIDLGMMIQHRTGGWIRGYLHADAQELAGMSEAAIRSAIQTGQQPVP